MSDLQPTPMSLFNEVTDINNFNDDNRIPFLDSNATSLEKVNAIIRYKNFKQLILNDILPISDSEIQTGINSNNINTSLLSNISQIQVNQYGRVVRIDGDTSGSTTTGGNAATGSFNIGNVLSISNYNSPSNVTQSSNYQAIYNGVISITGVATFLGKSGLQSISGGGQSSQPLPIGIKSNIKQSVVPLTTTILSATSSGLRQVDFPQYYTLYISGIIPCVQGETNWLITLNGVNYPFWNLTSNLTFINYPQ